MKLSSDVHELNLTIAQLVGPIQTTVLTHRHGRIPTRARQLWDDVYNHSREMLAEREIKMQTVLSLPGLRVTLASFKIYEAEGYLIRLGDMPNEAIAARAVGFSGETIASKNRDYQIISVAYWMACKTFSSPPRGAYTIYHGYDHDLTVSPPLWVTETLPPLGNIEAFVIDQIRSLALALTRPDSELPPCSEEETWSTAKRKMVRCYSHCPASHACRQFRRFQEERLKILGKRAAATLERC